MALRSFRVENEKALRLAVCEDVPPIMLIAGPNGVGKSTLLYALRQNTGVIHSGETKTIYQPPHRAIRRQQVRRRFLGGALRSLMDIFGGGEISGFEGMQVPFPQRVPDNVDEAGSTIKYTLGRIENRRQARLASLVDDHRERSVALETETLPNVYEPLARLTTKLLPHLAFRRIDFADEDNIRCVFARPDIIGTDELDIDDLSSGEKAIMLLFLPLIEHEIDEYLSQLEVTGATANSDVALSDRLFIVDEPEQHLHPELQGRILGYLREEVARQNVQFLIATHSPSLVDQAFDDELYVLHFANEPHDNQLRRVATTADRLEAIKALAGNTYVITTGRSLICLEGSREAASKPTDVRLLEILYQRATRYTFVPVGGKGNVIGAVSGLREALAAENFELRVFGLVDRDRAKDGVTGVVSWPVCTIENLLIVPAAIVASVAELRNQEATGVERAPVTLGDVAGAIGQAGEQLRAEEIEVRVSEGIGAQTIRIKGTSVEEAKAALEEKIETLRRDDDALNAIITAATREVDDALADGSFVQTFRGKELLRSIYNSLNLSVEQISYEKFAYALATECAKDAAVRELLDRVFDEFEEARGSGSATANQ